MTQNATTADAQAMADTERIDRYRFAHKSGERLLGRYIVQRGLGIGGFGEVYFAISDAGKEVALKEIQRNLEIELRGVSHCLNLKHTNLVSIHDICQDDAGRWWIVMEYVAEPTSATCSTIIQAAYLWKKFIVGLKAWPPVSIICTKKAWCIAILNGQHLRRPWCGQSRRLWTQQIHL